MNYYYSDPNTGTNEVLGPIPLDAIGAIYASGIMSENTLVSPEGSEEWISLLDCLNNTVKSDAELYKAVVNEFGGKPVVTNKVVVTDIKMPFMSMVEFMVMWALASIPAFIILSFIALAVFLVFGGVGSSILQLLLA